MSDPAAVPEAWPRLVNRMLRRMGNYPAHNWEIEQQRAVTYDPFFAAGLIVHARHRARQATITEIARLAEVKATFVRGQGDMP